MPVHLRPYETEDTQELLDLFYDTVHTINGKDYPPEQVDAMAPRYPDLKKKQAKFKVSKTVVAEKDKKIVGFGNLDNGLTTIGMLYVHKDFQGQRIASRLLVSLEKKLLKRQITKAVAEVSITAKPFFTRKGYHVVGENKKMLNGLEFLTYNMEKELIRKEESMGKDEKEKTEASKIRIKERPFQWKDLFINKFFDLLMVIIGVTIAFQLENLKTQSDDRSMEIFYLESMLGDLRKDKEQIIRILDVLNHDRSGIERYLKHTNAKTNPEDSLGTVLFDVLSFETFKFNKNTYAMLESNNGLTEFSNRNIRTQTTDYYNIYTAIIRFEQVYTNVLFNITTYINPYIDLEQRRILDRSLMSRPETKNWLLLASSELNDGIEDYKEALEKANALTHSIEEKLKKDGF